MRIEKVTTATKIGTFKKTLTGPNLIDIDYHVGSKILTDDSPRIYLFVSDGVIKKIVDGEVGGKVKVKGEEKTITALMKKRANLAKTLKKIK